MPRETHSASTTSGASLDGIPIAWAFCPDCQEYSCPLGHQMDESCERVTVMTAASEEHLLVPVCRVKRCVRVRQECLDSRVAFEEDPFSETSLFYVQTFSRRARSGSARAWPTIVAEHMLRIHDYFAKADLPDPAVPTAVHL